MSYVISSEAAWKDRALKAEAELQATEQKLHDFRREVSDVASVCAQHFRKNSWNTGDRQDHIDMLSRLIIIPAPKPDPLVEILVATDDLDYEPQAEAIRAALKARGLKIVEKNDG